MKTLTYIAICHIHIIHSFAKVNRYMDFENMTLQQLQVAIKGNGAALL